MGLTTDRNDPCLHVIEPNGMQRCYLVLSEEERGKGFVRPVRRAYIHFKCGSVTTMGLALCETYARDPKFYGGTFCVHCGAHFDLKSLDFEDPTARLKMLDRKPVLAYHFGWIGEDGNPDGSYVGE